MSLEDSASFLSSIFLFYFDPLLYKGSQKTLEHEDLGVVSKQDKCDLVYKKFVVFWERGNYYQFINVLFKLLDILDFYIF